MNKTIEDSDDPHSCLPCSKSRCVMWVLRLRGDAAPGQKRVKTGCREDIWVRQWKKKKKKEKKRGKALFVVCHSLSACKMLQEGCHRRA